MTAFMTVTFPQAQGIHNWELCNEIHSKGGSFSANQMLSTQVFQLMTLVGKEQAPETQSGDI